MPTLNELLQTCASLHHHLCPRQVLGVRMGIRAGYELGLDLPQANKRLFTFVETDGCAADGVSVATGCWVGKRTMRIVDYGKVAATFVDTETSKAIRIHPHPQSRTNASLCFPNAPSHWHGQLEAYQTMPDGNLLMVHPVTLSISLKSIISQPGTRTLCECCGEEIINQREVWVEGYCLCRACAGDRYYSIEVTQRKDASKSLIPGK